MRYCTQKLKIAKLVQHRVGNGLRKPQFSYRHTMRFAIKSRSHDGHQSHTIAHKNVLQSTFPRETREYAKRVFIKGKSGG
jgi:hypothetical protein